MALRLHILRKHDILTPVGKQICDTKEKERFSHPLMKAGKFIRKYNHIWTLLYIVFYMPWFMWLEKTVTTDFHLVSMPIDYKIPFCEYFIIPYLMWFAFIAAAFVYFFFTLVIIPAYFTNCPSLYLFLFQEQRGLLPHLYLPLHGHDDFPDHLHHLAQWSGSAAGYLLQQ